VLKTMICIECKSDNVTPQTFPNRDGVVCGNCGVFVWNMSDTSYTTTYTNQPCIECGELVDGEGVFSTGIPLEHYTPRPGELLKNNWMECSNCGWNQYS